LKRDPTKKPVGRFGKSAKLVQPYEDIYKKDALAEEEVNRKVALEQRKRKASPVKLAA
jgi:hypothetical protein